MVALSLATLCAAQTGAKAAAVIVSNNYQQYAKNEACGSQIACTLTFGALPTGKNLVVHQASCLVIVLSGGVRYAALETWRATGTQPLTRTFITDITGTGAGFNMAAADITHLAAVGHALKVKVETLNGQMFSVECSIAGQLIAS
jgi:hypothetical protein